MLYYAVLLASGHRVGISAFKEASRVVSIEGSLIGATRTWVCYIMRCCGFRASCWHIRFQGSQAGGGVDQGKICMC